MQRHSAEAKALTEVAALFRLGRLTDSSLRWFPSTRTSATGAAWLGLAARWRDSRRSLRRLSRGSRRLAA